MPDEKETPRTFDADGHINADLPVHQRIGHLLDADRTNEAVRELLHHLFGDKIAADAKRSAGTTRTTSE